MRRGITGEFASGTSWDCVNRRQELQTWYDGNQGEDLSRSDLQSFQVNYDMYQKACDPRFDILEGTVDLADYASVEERDQAILSGEAAGGDLIFPGCSSIAVCAGTGNVWVVE